MSISARDFARGRGIKGTGGQLEDMDETARESLISRRGRVRQRTVDSDDEGGDGGGDHSSSEDGDDEDNDVEQPRKKRQKTNRDHEELHTRRLMEQGIDATEEKQAERNLRKEIREAFAKRNDEKMERFSMHGHWQENGQYVEDEDDDRDGGERDEWMDMLSEQQQQSDYKPFKPKAPVQQNEEEEEGPDVHEQAKMLVRYLAPKESVLQALRRVGSKKGGPDQRKQQGWYAKKKQREEARKTGAGTAPQTTAAPDAKATAEAKRNAEAFIKITEAADNMMGAGVYSIYQMTREQLAAKIQKEERRRAQTRAQARAQARAQSATQPVQPAPSEAAVGNAAATSTAEKQWFYKFSGDASGKVNGPANSQQMTAWHGAGYLASALVGNSPSGPFVAVTADTKF